MTYCLFDSKGFLGDLASIHGLYELREFLSPRNAIFREFFDKGYTIEIAQFLEALSDITSEDDTINETILNLKGLLEKCRDIAIISNAVETEEDAERKKKIKERYVLPKGKRSDKALRQERALELFKPQDRRMQDYFHATLVEAAEKMGVEMTKGNHPFDLFKGKNVIDFIILPPDDLE